VEDQSTALPNGSPIEPPASASLPGRSWLWRRAAALVLGVLVGFYQIGQPTLLPDVVISGGVLVLAALLSLALDAQVRRKALALSITLVPLLVVLALSSLALVGIGVLLPTAVPPAPPSKYPCGDASLPSLPQPHLSGLALPLAALSTVPNEWLVFFLFIFPALVGFLTAAVAGFSVGVTGKEMRTTRALAWWCGVLA
jgi:hypothetical protein